MNTGYVVGDGGTIIKTLDGGVTWNLLQSGTTYELNSVSFPNSTTGYTAGDLGTILKTTNGGGPPVGIVEKQEIKRLKVYPNPATEIITIEIPESLYNNICSVFGMIGQELIRQQIQGSNVEINVSLFPQGIYFIRLMNKGKTGFGKFVKE